MQYMIRKLCVMILGLAGLFSLSACGVGDFKQQVKAPADKVYYALSGAQDYGSLLSSLNVSPENITVQREGRDAVIYRIKSSEDEDGTTIRFDIEAVDEATTNVSVSVTVPSVYVEADEELKIGANMFVSEARASLQLRGIMRNMAKSIESGAGVSEPSRQFNDLVQSINILTNPEIFAKLKSGDLAMFASAWERSDPGANNLDDAADTGGAMVDPNRGTRRAAAPMDAATGSMGHSDEDLANAAAPIEDAAAPMDDLR